MPFAPKAWKIRRPNPIGTPPWDSLASACNIPGWLARIAWLRGHATPEDLAWRLDPSWDRAHSPSLMPGIEAARERILAAIRDRERIVVYGDYDADGVTATALLTRAIQMMGGDVSWYVPNRFDHGYGIHMDCVLEVRHARNPSLMVSVDCGIHSSREVEACRGIGIDWVITDHHSLPAVLPMASAVVHPALGGYPNPHLAGVGVAFKLAQSLMGLDRADTPEAIARLDGMAKMVAIGSIADVVPLVGENALLVRRGLNALRSGNTPGVASILKAARIEDVVRAQAIAFGVAPRLNAVGRLGGAGDAVELFLCRDPHEAEALMARIEGYNTERKAIQKQLALALPPPDNPHFDIVARTDAHKGVVGIVAGHRMRRHLIPSMVCAVRDGIAHGSMRAPEGYDLTPMLAGIRPLILSGGGHAAAAGVSFRMEDFDAVRAALIDAAQTQAERLVERPAFVADGSGEACIPEDAPLDILEPYGQGFPPPVSVLSGQVRGKSVFSGVHWKLRIEGLKAPITWFFAGEDPDLRADVGDHVSVAAIPQGNPQWGRSWLAQEFVDDEA